MFLIEWRPNFNNSKSLVFKSTSMDESISILRTLQICNTYLIDEGLIANVSIPYKF